MIVRPALEDDITTWASLRALLWPEQTASEHRREVIEALADAGSVTAALVAATSGGEIVGFAEASLRFDHVNGCDTSPVAFLEGIYVQQDYRGAGIGRALVTWVESWGREKGCTELASDALLENRASHVFHLAIGFEETERIVYFRKLT